MSKKRAITLMVVAVLITNIITFGLTNIASGGIDLGMSFGNENKINESREISKVQNIKTYIKNNYLREVDDEKMLEGQLKGMVQSLNDPYSVYMTSDEFASFAQETSGVYGGIGVIVTPGEDNLITVVSPIEDTPGERAGIKTGDRIIRVNGVEYSAENMDEAVKVMKGKPKTKVTITIMRLDKEGNNQTLDLDIVREEIRLITVKSNIIDNNIGYIRITSFDELTYKDFKENLSKLEKSNIKGLIIDLRNNPGGLLNVCAEIADELLGAGDIVYTQTKDGTREYLKSDKNQITIPIVLLVNEGSASASEILAGAVKDHQRGELIGTKTFGKGVVQRIRELSDGSGIKLTVSEYFTPNGTNIHGIGITPDIVLELNEGVENIGPGYISEDNQLQKAVEVIKGKI
ncbi:S41 family peptidase [Paratissierella segnis]|uniref:S41 family peptidase n=1 Tax=Paratissierella segnis TaxID=2763679 RepID=A0A926ENU1_9FIRM|nr:S41 family peptidase [Paratissierella segnis]MBC8586938.1 S41 family peptidase [Paratissierella segnis]